MKEECDAHGLEYEILMQDAAKERFLRQVKNDGFNINDLSKHLVILKQKRASNSSEPTVGAAAPSDPTVAQAKPTDETVAAPLAKLASLTGFKAIAGLGAGLGGLGKGLPANWNINRILVDARNAFPTMAPLPTMAPINLKNAVTLPAASAPSLPSLPRISLPPASPLPTIAPFSARRPAAAASPFNWRVAAANPNAAASGPVVSPNSD